MHIFFFLNKEKKKTLKERKRCRLWGPIGGREGEVVEDELAHFAAAVGGGLLSVFPGHDDVPVVLDGVVGSPRKQARDHRPFVAVEAVRRHEPLLLLLRERPPVYPRVQLVEPPQPAAFPFPQSTIQN